MSKSIITNYPKFCVICGRPAEIHHCPYGTANRKLADEDGLVIPLCPDHHRNGKMAAHKCKEVDVLVHIISELAWEKHYIAQKRALPFEEVEELENDARESFRKRYGQNWI